MNKHRRLRRRNRRRPSRSRSCNGSGSGDRSSICCRRGYYAAVTAGNCGALAASGCTSLITCRGGGSGSGATVNGNGCNADTNCSVTVSLVATEYGCTDRFASVCVGKRNC